MSKSDIGVYGLGVMGSNLALNLEEKGYQVSIYNRLTTGEEHMLDNFLDVYGKGKQFKGATSIKEFVRSISSPRKILIIVKAGPPVDAVIKQLSAFLDPGDILIDSGNSHYLDTIRRKNELKSKGLLFIGMGISGGEEGARYGPSLMPGGDPEAWKFVEPLLTSIAATAPDGTPCCSWIGTGGAGHFVKMVHNGIEYADMQLISEAYSLMKTGLGMDSGSISKTFDKWNEGLLNSYLMEISSDIFLAKDEDGSPLMEKILDSARQKGTGKWTVMAALDMGIPLSTISEAVSARFISSFNSLREKASEKLKGSNSTFNEKPNDLLEALEQALLASRIIALAEGFFLIKTASNQYGWNINCSSVSRIWQNGCIIRSSLLKTITGSFEKEPELEHLLLVPAFSRQFKDLQSGWRKTVSTAVQLGIPVPGLTAALNQYDSLRSKRLPANLIQAQRDYFGAHTYERLDKPRGTFYHTDWQKLKK